MRAVKEEKRTLKAVFFSPFFFFVFFSDENNIYIINISLFSKFSCSIFKKRAKKNKRECEYKLRATTTISTKEREGKNTSN